MAPLVLVLLLHASAHAFGAATTCPTNPSKNRGANASAEHCALFCNGTCPYHPDWSPMRPENLTVYRLTPANVTGLAQRDTGDAGGDAGFYAGMMLVHLESCEPPYTSWGCFLANQPVITKYSLRLTQDSVQLARALCYAIMFSE